MAFLVAFLAPPSEVVPHDAEPELHLDQVKSMQVSGGLIAPTELDLSSETLEGPFRAVLFRRGVKVDSNDYDHVVSTNCEVARSTAGGATVYAVRVSSEYRELCTADRLKVPITCALWSTLDLVRTFKSAQLAREYVVRVLSQQAGEFARQFDPK